MKKRSINSFTLGLICILALAGVRGEGLNQKLVVTPARLPGPTARHAAIHDGNDSIYVLGGRRMDSIYSDEIVKYSLESGRVEVVARFPHGVYGLSAVSMGEHILTFGGYGYPDGVGGQTATGNVTQYNPSTGILTIVGNLPQEVYYSGAAMPTTTMNQTNHEPCLHIINHVYILGGTQDESDPVFWYHTPSQSSQKLAEYPRRYRHAAVYDPYTAHVYILGGTSASEGTSREILRFDPNRNTATKIPALFPYDVEYPCAVWASGAIFVIDGPKLLLLNPFLPDLVEAIDVGGWPGNFTQVACTYVPELDRIYILGGFINDRLTDQIMYIDLIPNSTPNPTTEEENESSAAGVTNRIHIGVAQSLLVFFPVAIILAFT